MAKKEKTEAAEKIVNAEKTKAKKPKSDKPFIFVRMWRAIVRFCKDFKGEIKKIVWPDRKTVLKNTGVVLAVVTVFVIFIWLIDMGLSKSIELLSNVARGADETVSQAADETSTTAAALDNLVETQASDSTTAVAAATEGASETAAQTQAATSAAAE